MVIMSLLSCLIHCVNYTWVRSSITAYVPVPRMHVSLSVFRFHRYRLRALFIGFFFRSKKKRVVCCSQSLKGHPCIPTDLAAFKPNRPLSESTPVVASFLRSNHLSPTETRMFIETTAVGFTDGKVCV